MQSVAHFETQNAPRYLAALCQHFGRKVEAHSTAQSGWVQFPFGRCDFSATTDRLEMTATAAHADALAMVVDLVTRHLERYAFRENPSLDWRSSDGTETPNSEKGS